MSKMGASTTRSCCNCYNGRHSGYCRGMQGSLLQRSLSDGLPLVLYI